MLQISFNMLGILRFLELVLEAGPKTREITSTLVKRLLLKLVSPGITICRTRSLHSDDN